MAIQKHRIIHAMLSELTEALEGHWCPQCHIKIGKNADGCPLCKAFTEANYELERYADPKGADHE